MLVSTEEELWVQTNCMTFSEWTTLKHRQLEGLYTQLGVKLLDSCCSIVCLDCSGIMEGTQLTNSATKFVH